MTTDRAIARELSALAANPNVRMGHAIPSTVRTAPSDPSTWLPCWKKVFGGKR